MNMNTATVSLAVTPTVVSTLVTHYLKRKPLKHRPTAHLSYDEGLHLIKSFLTFASHHTVEDLQAFTSQWVPHPQWVKVEEVRVPEAHTLRAASLLEEQLGPEGVRKVGGRKWWQWRRPNSPLKAEWVEMRTDYNQRKNSGELARRVMLYVHGGAYFFGSVDEHRYQLQRHARKLKARVIAPRYRLAPQFPFPCGLQDCLATYLYLLASGYEANTIVLAGDSAGGGMVLSVLVTLRDRGIPLPAGAVLISPWVDLTHSFPSVSSTSSFDYIPECGFHHKPSEAWPPPTNAQLRELRSLVRKNDNPKSSSGKTEGKAISDNSTLLSVVLNSKPVEIEEQIQMYTTNELLSHPLVSPVMQPTLGGLPPLFIMVGGGEILRDEQIYLAHKCAAPAKYLPRDALLDDAARASIKRFKPTDVQLQVWDDLCHVAPTLSFTRPAKHMYRSIAQFGAWALARAQRTEIDILDDDDISVISSGVSDSDSNGSTPEPTAEGSSPVAGKGASKEDAKAVKVGKAGDPLPPFKEHMIRQRVSRHGHVFPLAPATELPGCCQDREMIGCPKEGPVGKWLEAKKHWNSKYSSNASRIHKKRVEAMAVGYETFGGDEVPPPSALAGRRKLGAADVGMRKRTRSVGLALWSLWGSRHDEMTVEREQQADREPEMKHPGRGEGAGARPFSEIRAQNAALGGPSASAGGLANSRSHSRRRLVRDENQAGSVPPSPRAGGVDESTPVAELIALRRDKEAKAAESAAAARAGGRALDTAAETGATGKRPYVGGISVPFTLRKEAETASMLTLKSGAESSTGATTRPLTPATTTHSKDQSEGHGQATERREEDSDDDEEETANVGSTRVQNVEAQDMAAPLSPALFHTPLAAPGESRPPLEKFVTAQEDLPRAAPNT